MESHSVWFYLFIFGLTSFTQHTYSEIHSSCMQHYSQFVLIVKQCMWICHTPFIPSHVDEHLDLFNFITNAVALNIQVQVFVWLDALISLGQLPICFPGGCTIILFLLALYESFSSFTSSPTHDTIFLILAILKGVYTHLCWFYLHFPNH